jgi:hypothetical protein
MTQLIEETFFRAAGATGSLGSFRNIRNFSATMPVSVIVALNVTAGNITVDVTGDTTGGGAEATNWSLFVQWQDGGLAS